MRRWLAAAAAVLLALILYLGWWPVPPDLPTASGAPAERGEARQPCPARAPAAEPRTLEVRQGESIQAAVEAAGPGDRVLVHPGLYFETVKVEVNDLTLEGAVSGDGRPILDGRGEHRNGIEACADGFRLQGFHIRHYTQNGVLVHNARGVVLRDVFAQDTGEYGLYPVQVEDVVVEQSTATGASDTGIYVGQARKAVIRDSEAYGNVSGFEVENSTDVQVTGNHAHGNTAGILVFVLSDLKVRQGRNTRVVGNLIEANNLPNFAPDGEIVAEVPAGTGILIMAADDTEVTGNEIRDNRSVGVAVIGLRQLYPGRRDFNVGTEPEGTWIHDNVYHNNGYDPDPAVEAAGLPGADLLWDGSGWDNRWSEARASRFPPLLPGEDWPSPLRRAYWRLIGLARQLL